MLLKRTTTYDKVVKPAGKDYIRPQKKSDLADTNKVTFQHRFRVVPTPPSD